MRLSDESGYATTCPAVPCEGAPQWLTNRYDCKPIQRGRSVFKALMIGKSAP